MELKQSYRDVMIANYRHLAAQGSRVHIDIVRGWSDAKSKANSSCSASESAAAGSAQTLSRFRILATTDIILDEFEAANLALTS